MRKRVSRLRALWGQLDRRAQRTMVMMAATVIALHIVGFALLLTVATRGHAAGAGALTVGLGLTAYTLGLRHAFDADHISAIDNTTRKLMADGERPLSTGFWFSLGHSSVVFAIAFLISVGARSLDAPLSRHGSQLHQVTGWLGALISGGFLYAIGALNLVILLGLARVAREMKRGQYDELALERQLQQRGLMNRLLGRATRAVSKPRDLYPVGLLFGLGFDTASEVALLVLAGGAAGAGLPWYAILCLPVLFAAGMSLLDSLDGWLMSFAYGWAFSRPARKVFYNLTVTGLSVAVALIVGTIEIGGLAASRLGLGGSFWTWFENINLNLLGFVIIGVFLATWAIAVLVWRLRRIEERWSAYLGESPVP